jgi:hypothetical protein
MKNPIHFAYTALIEIVDGVEPNILVEEMLCNAVFYPIHEDAPAILGSVKLPAEPGTYQAWANGQVIHTEQPHEAGVEYDKHIDINFSAVVPAPPDCIQMLIAAAQEQRTEAGPKIEVYSEGDAAAVTNLLEKRRVH